MNLYNTLFVLDAIQYNYEFAACTERNSFGHLVTKHCAHVSFRIILCALEENHAELPYSKKYVKTVVIVQHFDLSNYMCIILFQLPCLAYSTVQGFQKCVNIGGNVIQIQST